MARHVALSENLGVELPKGHTAEVLEMAGPPGHVKIRVMIELAVPSWTLEPLGERAKREVRDSGWAAAVGSR